jgi:hypothetical protein
LSLRNITVGNPMEPPRGVRFVGDEPLMGFV